MTGMRPTMLRPTGMNEPRPREIGSIKSRGRLTSDRASHPTIHRPPCPARGPGGARRAGRQPALVLASAETQDLFRADRRRPVGRRPTTTRSGCSARSPATGSTSWPGTSEFLAHARAGQRPTSTTTSPARAGTSSACDASAPPRSPTSRPSSASPPCSRSTPAASASSPATTSRPPATSACRSSASACSTATATSASRSPARAGSRRPTRSSTPTACRCRCCARTTARAAQVSIDLPGEAELKARIWVAQVGRVPLLLLDSDVEENADRLRDVTDRLYGGTTEHRLLQEMLLGIGGVRALRAYARITGSPAPEVFHTNEGHAGFLGLERIRELTVAEDGPRPRLRRRARGLARRHRLHHPHPRPGRHRPLPARPGRAVLRRQQPHPRRARSSGSSRSAPRTTRAATRRCSTWR